MDRPSIRRPCGGTHTGLDSRQCHVTVQVLKGAQRVYLPIFWVGLLKVNAPGWRARLQKFISSLDKRCGRSLGATAVTSTYWNCIQIYNLLYF